MAGTQKADLGLVPIDEVARRLGLRASAIRYYEERGLIQPASRRAGRRWYAADQIRRLAIISYWQTSALMSLEEIGDILAGPGATRSWSQLVDDRLESLRIQIDRMVAAREFLQHIRTYHPESAPDGCAHFETLIWGEPASGSVAASCEVCLDTAGWDTSSRAAPALVSNQPGGHRHK
jgi:MerR family transcriptional regulator, copper efflux regulator